MKATIKRYFKKYKHFCLVLYFLFYLPWFFWLNKYTPTRGDDINIIHSKLDDLIPFNELFVIPYYIWFVYIAAGYIFLMLTNQSDFCRMCSFMYIGMTVCLIIFTIYPNGHELRVNYDTLGRDNFFIDAIKLIQQTDTPQDVFPSIHCLNSIGMNIALAKNKTCRKNKFILIGATTLTILICLSTVMIKQHSILDVFGAILLSIPLYLISYVVPWKKYFKLKKSVPN